MTAPHECPHCGGFLAEHDVSILTFEYSPESLTALRKEIAKAVLLFADKFELDEIRQFAKALAAGLEAGVTTHPDP